ncbi:MAG: hypothetical protein KKE37_01285 [Verrucomicrobia bacterium]|nr:hypothetical protein [Verrucomicrobiota bacterium]MBU4427967.1 hypothetical protein [Verrucomicrobiota bacterium]MCG2681555.1 hypothetical protein [Kiritimatiellia bacterium]
MKTRYIQLLTAACLLGMASLGATAEAPPDPKKKAFDDLCLKVQRGKSDVTEADLTQVLTSARELGYPYPAAAAVKSFSAMHPALSPQLQVMAAENSLLAGDFRAAVTRYKSYLTSAPADKASSDLAARMLIILIDYLNAEGEAYAFMNAEGAPFRQSENARKFDLWFLDMALRKGDVLAAAKRLAPLFSEKMPVEQEKFFYWDYLDWAMSSVRHPTETLYPAAPILAQLLSLLRADNRTLVKYRFYLANLDFKAANAGKAKEAAEAAFASVLTAAKAYFDASPRAETLQDIEEVFSSGFKDAEWKFCQKAKQEFFTQAFARVPDEDRVALIRWMPGNTAYLAGPEQWESLCLAYPSAFARAGLFIYPRANPEVFRKQAPFLADVATPYAAVVKALAAGTDLETCARHLLEKESWHLQTTQFYTLLVTELWPSFRNFTRPEADKLPADYYSKFLAKFGSETLMKTPVPLMDTNAAAAFVMAAWESGEKPKLPDALHLLDAFPYSEAERSAIFDPAYKAFKDWAGKVGTASESVAMAKVKIERGEKAAARKKAAAEAKKAAEAKVAAGNTQAQAELKAANDAWTAADSESAQAAGAAADAAEVLKKFGNGPNIGANQISAMETAFKAVLDPKVFNPDKAASPLCKNLALILAAVQDKKQEDYEKIARQIYGDFKDYSAKKTPLGAAVLSLLLDNRPSAFDTLDFQVEVLTDQLARWGTGPTNQSVSLVYATIVAGRPGWPSRAPTADQPNILKVNEALEKALLAQIDKGQFSPTLFQWFRETRRGNGWQNDDAGLMVMGKLIQQKLLLNSAYRLNGDTAATTLMWLIRNEFPKLKDQYPSESFFDDLYVEECARNNKLDFAYWNYGADSKGKIVNLATRLLQSYSTLPFSYRAFGPTNDLWKWHSQCLQKNAAWRKEHGVNEDERGKLIAMLAAAYGANRFDEFARGDYYFAANATADTPESRATFFQKLTAFIAQTRTTPERVPPPSLEVLAKLKDFTPNEINAFLAFFPATTPARWTTGRSYELLLPAIHNSLLAQKRYPDLLSVIPFFWKMAKDMNSNAMSKQIADYATALLEKQLPDLAGVYSGAGLDILGTSIPDDIRITLMGTRLKALVSIGGAIPVDRTDPRYPIFAAQTAYLSGNLQNAWELYLSVPDKVLGMFKELDPNFCLWLINQNTEIRDFKRSEDLSRSMMQWLDSLPEGFDREIQARLMIAYGDIAFARQEFPKARAMYERIVATKTFDGTKARNAAELRIAEVDRLTKNYDSAIVRLEKLSRRMDRYLQTESAYQLALIKFDQEDYLEAYRCLETVFALEPNHVEGRIFQGRINLELRKYMSATDINVGLLSSQKIIVPGNPIKIRLDDRNLAVVGKNAQIEIRVWSDSGDEEFLNLILSGDSKTRFEGQLPTSLEPTAKGDHILQVLGNEKIHYDYSEKFRNVNRIASSEPMSMTVVSDAVLTVAAGNIPSAAQEQAESLQLLMDQARIGDLLGTGQSNAMVRPGNPIYIRVTDLDKSTTPQKDTVAVKVTAFSGDSIPDFPLQETATHSGVFAGVVPTAAAGAQAYASDSSEGRFPFYAISAETYPAWVALPNNLRPKTFSVDLNDNVLPGTMNIAADTPGRKLKQFFVQLSINGKDFSTVGSWPAPFKPWDGSPGLEFVAFTEKIPPQNLAGIRQYIEADSIGRNIQRATLPLSSLLSKTGGTLIEFAPDKVTLPAGNVAGHLRAAFTLPSRQTRTFKLTTTKPATARCFFAIDGQEADPSADKMAIQRSFKKGTHFIDVYFYAPQQIKWTIELLCDSDAPPYMISCPRSLFELAANPDIAAVLPQTAATVSNNTEQTSFDIRFAPETRARVIRLILADFETDAPAIRKFSLTSADGKPILPTKSDFVAASKNQILEIVAGDKISIAYEDDNVVTKGKEIQEQFMSANFHNGTISACTYIDVGDEKQYMPVYRFAPGEKFDVMIDDPDCDVSDKQDVVKFTAKTPQAKAVELQALETEEHSGKFIGSVFIVKGQATRTNELVVAPEENIIVAFDDKENTDPGIPWIRQQVVQQISSEPPQLRVYEISSIPLDEKKIEALRTKAAGMLAGSLNREESYTPSRDLIATRPVKADTTRPATIISEGPLLVELLYPALSLSSISTAEIYIQTKSARQAAGAPETGFDPAVPGTIKLSAFPREFPGINPPPGYATVLLRGDPYAASPVVDGRFSYVVLKTFGGGSALATNEPLDMSSTAPKAVVLQNNDKIFVGFPYADAAGATNWLVQPVVMTNDVFIDVMDRIYRQTMSSIHVGENLYLRINDRSRDVSAASDTLPVTITTASGFSTNLTLSETFEHTGCFKGMIKPTYFEDKSAAGEAGAIPVKYGDCISVTYTRGNTNQPSITRSVLVAKGADGTVVPFTKQFKDPDMAIKTQFTTAEAFFELAKKHRTLEQTSLARREIAQGRKLLEEAIRDYPNMQVRAQADYLLADLTLEFANDAADENIRREKYMEAINQFSEVVMVYPESIYAPKAQYKKALTFEKMGDIDRACEEYVKLSYLYPDNELVAETIARLGNYFSSKGKDFLDKAKEAKSPEDKQKQNDNARTMFKTAAEVFSRLAPRFPTHELAGKTLVLSGQCYMRAGELGKSLKQPYPDELHKAAQVFDAAIKQITGDNDLIAEAMYWRGDTFMKLSNYPNAYRQFKKLTWDYPASKWAKFARGRLTEQAMDSIVQAEAVAQ